MSDEENKTSFEESNKVEGASVQETPANDIVQPTSEDILAKISNETRDLVKQFAFSDSADEMSDEDFNELIRKSYEDILSSGQTEEDFFKALGIQEDAMKQYLEKINAHKTAHSSKAEEDFNKFIQAEWGKESKIILEKAEEYSKRETGISLSDISPSRRKEVIKHIKENKLVLNKAVDFNTNKNSIPTNQPKEPLSPLMQKIVRETKALMNFN